ncbi:MAG: hypothetical protein ABFS18_14440 [Thermodesulfobacteriota bacterium]
MVGQTKKKVAEKDEPVRQNLFTTGITAAEGEVQQDRTEQDKKPLSVADLRNASYFVLIIAAIFVINALETGSYRTPWPVAVIVSLVGFWLLASSFVKAKRERTET